MKRFVLSLHLRAFSVANTMEVRWTHTFPEGTSLDDIRAFFCRTASSGLPDAVLKDTSTGDICALAQGPRTSGQYDLLVKQAVKPVVESAWKKPVFKHSEASESEPDSTTKVFCRVRVHWHAHMATLTPSPKHPTEGS